MVGLLARILQLERLEQRLVAGAFLHTVGQAPFTSGSGCQPSGGAPGQWSGASARLASAGQYQSGACPASCPETDSAAYALTARRQWRRRSSPVVYAVGYLIHEAVAVAVDRFYYGFHRFFAHFLGDFFYSFHKQPGGI